VLQAVHTAMRDHHPATFCTVCFAMYHAVATPDGGTLRQHLDISLGGHPMPLLARGDEVDPIGRVGTVLGMVEPTVTDERIDVRAGDTLVLFTDGLTDAPSAQSLTTDEVADLVREGASSDVDDLADRIGERTRMRRPSGSGDDTAIVVVRFGVPLTDPGIEESGGAAVVAPYRSAGAVSA